MWYEFRPTEDVWRVEYIRRNAWVYRRRSETGSYGTDAEITPEGWIITQSVEWGGGVERRLIILHDNGGVRLDVPLTADEYQNWPTLGRGWEIPF